ncbi:hypothetical protein AB0M79_19935 [Polymorphospora sp. NPDC051019]|uniref:hypothetical protein n=1 Tax=Polymorphospora sp. NPDC051019 TaxID=3155725 RepID=UPI00341AFD14
MADTAVTARSRLSGAVTDARRHRTDGTAVPAAAPTSAVPTAMVSEGSVSRWRRHPPTVPPSTRVPLADTGSRERR